MQEFLHFGGECQALKCTKNWILGLHYCTAFPPAQMWPLATYWLTASKSWIYDKGRYLDFSVNPVAWGSVHSRVPSLTLVGKSWSLYPCWWLDGTGTYHEWPPRKSASQIRKAATWSEICSTLWLSPYWSVELNGMQNGWIRLNSVWVIEAAPSESYSPPTRNVRQTDYSRW